MAKEPKCPLANIVCPRNNDPAKGKYCPAWIEYIESNVQTGAQRMKQECSFGLLPKLMVDLARSCDAPAAVMESNRNEIAQGFAELNQRMQRIPALLLENRHEK